MLAPPLRVTIVMPNHAKRTSDTRALTRSAATTNPRMPLAVSPKLLLPSV